MGYRAIFTLFFAVLILFFQPAVASSEGLDQARISYLLGHFNDAHEQFSQLEDNAEAQYLLARMYEHGDGIEPDLEVAQMRYHLAWQLGHELAEQRLHQIANNLAGEEVVVIQWHRWHAEEGDVAAQYHLARMFDIGWGVFPNPKAAAEWYQAAVSQGHDTSMLRLGLIYMAGAVGGDKFDEGRQLIRRAVTEGNKLAKYWQEQVMDAPDLSHEEQQKLAAGFRRLVEELDEAKAWLPAALVKLRASPQHVHTARPDLPGGNLILLRKRAIAGDPKSIFLLGMRYIQGAGVERDALEGLRWIRTAADLGYQPAADYQELWFGALEGYGDADSIAYYEYIDRAREGSVQALFEIALLFENGRGVEVSTERARKWYGIAALLGHEGAVSRLNFMPREEIPLVKPAASIEQKSYSPTMNAAIAIMLLPAILGLYMLWRGRILRQAELLRGKVLASEKPLQQTNDDQLSNDELAQSFFNIARLFVSGKGVDRNVELAARWMLKSARLGLAPAQFALSTMYRDGQGVEANSEQELLWLKKAAAQGYNAATARLTKMGVD